MKIGLIAISGVKLQTRKFIELGITLPQFMNRGQVVAQLPNLALLILAGATPEGADVEYLEVDDVAAHAAAPRPDFDLVALSTYTARAFDAYLVADAYRAAGVPLVFGGLHATVLPEEAAEHADAVVIGEGEATWPEVVRDFQRGGRPALKRFYREGQPGRYDLAHAPMPRYDLLTTAGEAVPADTPHTGQINRLGPYNRITVQTTRGCPWDCEFCAASKLYGPRYRTKPVERVLREVDAVRSLWRRPFIEFADDNTFVHRSWSKELLDLLYPSGCRQVLIGFESPRRASLDMIDRANWKAGQHARYLPVIEAIQARAISVCGCFIVGLDEDTPAVFDEIREFVEQAQLLEVQITVLTPFPGTRLYERLQAEGRLLYPGAWDRCTLFDVNFRPRGMTVDELEEGVMQLWRDTWNADAFAGRKRRYRELLRRRRGSGLPAADETEEYFALPTAV